MKYDLLQIIKDKIKILEKNKMAALVLEKILKDVPTNIGEFEKDILYFTKKNYVEFNIIFLM